MALVACNGNVSHFSAKPSCFICTEDFDDKLHIPKVLECGHTMCVACIARMIESIQVLIVGDGELQKNISCTVCNRSMPIPRLGARGFATNYQLLDAMKPVDSRFITCTECHDQGNENAFHICRECTIENHSYDITDLIDHYGDIELNMYAICSSCALSNHNNNDHTLVKFFSLMNYWNCNKNNRIVKPIGAEVQKNFDEVRTMLATTPFLMSKFVKQIETMAGLMYRCKSSQQQTSVLTRYQQEMAYVNGVFANLKKTIGALNRDISNKTATMREDIEKVEGLYCYSDVETIEKILSKCVEKRNRSWEMALQTKKEEEEEKQEENQEEKILDNEEVEVKEEKKQEETVTVIEKVEEKKSSLTGSVCGLVCSSFIWSAEVLSTEVESLVINRIKNNGEQIFVKFLVLTIWIMFIILVFSRIVNFIF